MRIDFDWDPAKEGINLSKHGVAFEQAMSVFRDPLARSVPDYFEGEERWVTMGETALEICWWSCTLGQS